MSSILGDSQRDIPIETETLSGDQKSGLIVSEHNWNGRAYELVKRLFDIFLSICALLVTGPIIIISALAVMATSEGPAFYRAKRAGFRGKPFHMYKLRTMQVNTDSVDQRVTAEHDNRITPVGAVLRKYKIDELAQFWNVLVGDMSIVGPRPEDWDIVQQHYTPEQRRIFQVRPGIACSTEVRWYPDLTYHDPPPTGVPIQEWYIRRHLPVQVDEGLHYIEQRNLLLDLKLIGQTAYCILIHARRPPEKQPLAPIPSENN
jgi:lipopolysaccharide/colanic/teichoic acid biosynthesis glycosyltransferase